MEKRTIVIEEVDGELVLTVLKKGYNIVDFTLYNEQELAQQLLDKIEERDNER